VQLPFPFKDYFSKEKVEVVLIGEPNEWAAIRKCFYNKRFCNAFYESFPDMKVIRVDERFTKNGSSIHA
jgi:putative Holliday junction resolvase